MRSYISLLSYLLVVGLLTTCRQKDPEPDYLSDGTPRLKSIFFSGIPQENISIDQKTKVIRVNMPSVVLDQIGIAVEPTEKAVWLNKTSYISASAFGCNPCHEIIIVDSGTVNYGPENVYTIQPVANAPLKAALLTEPIRYSIRKGVDDRGTLGIDFPMLNLYGNKLPKEAHLIHEATGERLIIKADTIGSGYFGVHYSSLSNRLGIYLFEQKLLLGLYRIDLILADGSKLTIPQPLLVSKGDPEFDYEAQTYFGYRVTAGNTFMVKGYNLFEGDVRFELVSQQGKVYALSNVVFERYGQLLQVSVPTALPPGQYVLGVYISEVKQPYCLRVNIVKDTKDRPILGTLVTKEPSEASPCSLIEPVITRRGIDLFFTSNQEKSALDKLSQQVNLLLTSVTSGISYSASVVPYTYSNGGLPGSFTVPITVPSGLYTARLQVLDSQNKVVNESDPYGRLLNVQ